MACFRVRSTERKTPAARAPVSHRPSPPALSLAGERLSRSCRETRQGLHGREERRGRGEKGESERVQTHAESNGNTT